MSRVLPLQHRGKKSPKWKGQATPSAEGITACRPPSHTSPVSTWKGENAFKAFVHSPVDYRVKIIFYPRVSGWWALLAYWYIIKHLFLFDTGTWCDAHLEPDAGDWQGWWWLALVNNLNKSYLNYYGKVNYKILISEIFSYTVIDSQTTDLWLACLTLKKKTCWFALMHSFRAT